MNHSSLYRSPTPISRSSSGTTGVRVMDSVFTPNRIDVDIAGGPEPSRLFVNQSYAPGWRSTVGRGHDGAAPQEHRRHRSRRAAGRLSVAFSPPGLIDRLGHLRAGRSGFAAVHALAVSTANGREPFGRASSRGLAVTLIDLSVGLFECAARVDDVVGARRLFCGGQLRGEALAGLFLAHPPRDQPGELHVGVADRRNHRVEIRRPAALEQQRDVHDGEAAGSRSIRTRGARP